MENIENTNKNINEMDNKLLNKQFIFSKNVNIVDKYNFYDYLSIMLDWWVSISESLESAWEKVTSIYFKQKILELLTYISSWDSFSKSMRKIPQIFDNSEISIIEAWETTGSLVESLSKISEDLKKVHELKNKIKSALTYPAIIFLFLILAVIVVLTYVIPSIKPLFDTSWVDLPFATKALIFTSDFIKTKFYLIILFVFAIFVFFVWYKNTKTWKMHIESFLLWLPLIWKVYQNFILAKVASTLWNLVGSWVNILKTLSLVWKISNNIIYENLFEEIILRVSKWEKIVDSMRNVDPEKKYFPSNFTQMLSVWEKTASIEAISKKVSSQYEKEVTYSLSNLTKWIEPIAIFIAWLFVVWFAFAIFWAILKVTQTVS